MASTMVQSGANETIGKRTRVELGLLLAVASAAIGAAVAFGLRLGAADEVQHNQVALTARVQRLEASDVNLQVQLAAINSDPVTVSGNGLVAILCGDTRGIADAGFAASPGTVINSGISQGGNAAESVEYLFTGGLSAQVLSANVGGDAATPQDDWTIKALIVAPFTYS